MAATTESVDATVELVTIIEEFVDALIYAKTSDSNETQMDLARKRASLVVFLINRDRAMDRKYERKYDAR